MKYSDNVLELIEFMKQRGFIMTILSNKNGLTETIKLTPFGITVCKYLKEGFTRKVIQNE